LAVAGALDEDLARDVAAVLSIRVRRKPQAQQPGQAWVGILPARWWRAKLDADRCDYLFARQPLRRRQLRDLRHQPA